MDASEPALPVRPYIPPSAAMAASSYLAAAVMLQVGWERRDQTMIVPVGAVLALVAVALTVALSCLAPRMRAAWRTGRPGALSHPVLRRVRCDGRAGMSDRMLPAPERDGSCGGGRPAKHGWCRAGMFCAAGLLIGTAAGTVWLFRWAGCVEALAGMPVSSFEMIVEGDPSIGQFGVSSTVALRRPGGEVVARVWMTARKPLEQGEMLRGVGRIEELDAGEWGRSRFMKGEVASVRLVKVIERRAPAGSPVALIRRAVLDAIDPASSPARALLAGTVCGRTTELNETQASEAFSRCGLTHLVAVSGSHLAFIAALIEAALRRTRASVALRRAVLLSVMVAYVAFTGMAPSAVRSVSMVGTASAAVMGRRRPHALSGLMLAVTAMVVLDAGVVFDLGFQLSALSVLFILLLGGYITCVLRRLHIPAALAEALALTLAAQWATLPLTVPVFGELSLIAPVANLLVGPVMTALLVSGLAAVPLALMAPLTPVALALPDFFAHASIFLAELLGNVPYAAIALEAGPALPLAAYGAATAVYLAWRNVRPARLVVALAVVVFLLAAHIARWTLFAPPQVVVLDVGQGDAILIRDGACAVLVDAGVDEATCVALARNSVWRLDAVVVTHWDRDHWGGLPAVLEHVPVGRLVVAEGAREALPKELEGLSPTLAELVEGDRLNVGDFTCEAVWPRSPVEGTENAESLCLAVRYGDGESPTSERLSVLLTGDTERGELAHYVEAVGDVDVLKLGHHGSAESLAEEPLLRLRPEVAVASAGEGNAYGHPSAEARTLAEEAGAAFLCTKDVGDITLEPGVSGPRVRTRG